MSEADKMFEKLEYGKQELIEIVIYENKNDEEIYIDKKQRTVIKEAYLSSLNIYEAREITMQELQAINMKCKELRMDMKPANIPVTKREVIINE